MVSRVVEIVNETGLHCRPGNQFVKEAKKFSCDIQAKKDGNLFNAKNLLKLMKIGVSKGDKIELICNGDDEAAALEHLSSFIANLTE
jgi:phosphocarrier protein HPr